MKRPYFIDMDDYKDDYYALKEEYREGLIDYDYYIHAYGDVYDRINKDSLMKDVNYFLNFFKSEINRISSICEDDVYIVVEIINSDCDVLNLRVLKDLKQFNYMVKNIFLYGYDVYSYEGAVKVILNEDNSIFIDSAFTEYKIGYITKSDFNTLNLKLTKGFNEKEYSFKVGKKIIESISYEKFYFNNDNKYYSLYEEKKYSYNSYERKGYEDKYLKIEKKDFDIIDNLLESNIILPCDIQAIQGRKSNIDDENELTSRDLLELVGDDTLDYYKIISNHSFYKIYDFGDFDIYNDDLPF